MPKISVIIPTYNRADFISETITSVLNQSQQDFEIIIVDDGSTDNTHKIVAQFSDFRIRYIYQENQGAGAARNNGIRNSSADYIVFLDSDDTLLTNALEKGAAILDEYPEVDLSYGQTYILDLEGNVSNTPRDNQIFPGKQEGNEKIEEFLKFGYSFPIHSMLLRRSVLKETGLFNPCFRYGSEDFDFIVRICKNHTIFHLAEPVAIYRIHPGSNESSRRVHERANSKAKVFESIFSDPEIGPQFSSLRPYAYSRQYSVLAVDAYTISEMQAARKYLYKAVKSDPLSCFPVRWLSLMILYAKTLLPQFLMKRIQKRRKPLK